MRPNLLISVALGSIVGILMSVVVWLIALLVEMLVGAGSTGMVLGAHVGLIFSLECIKCVGIITDLPLILRDSECKIDSLFISQNKEMVAFLGLAQLGIITGVIAVGIGLLPDIVEFTKSIN
jgi:hypothetical protein